MEVIWRVTTNIIEANRPEGTCLIVIGPLVRGSASGLRLQLGSAETSFQSESSVNCFSSSVAVLVQNEGSTEVSERFYSYVSDVASAVKVRFP